MHAHPKGGDPASALSDLRRARRSRRMGDVSFFDVAYRVYVTALLSLFAAFTASGWIGDEVVSDRTVQRVLTDAPPVLGLVAALGLLAGVRVGSRGGPLAIESADVHHVLLAPISRRVTLRRPFIRAVGTALLWSAILGGLAGDLAAQRLPGSSLSWIASGALAAGIGAALGVGAALLVAGRGLPRAVPFVVALGLVAWSIADVADRGSTAPFTFLGRVALWPLSFEPAGLAFAAIAVLVLLAAERSIGGLSIEAARRRTALVGQLRFAVTQQDLRTVLVLRRQLADEGMRDRPWLPMPRGRLAAMTPVFTRDGQSLMRWPTVRVARVVALGVVIGLCMRGVWSGTTPLVLLAGVAAFVAALDAIEPMAQDLDHPTRLFGFPRPRGWVLVRHLAAPAVAMIGLGLVAIATAFVVDPHRDVLVYGFAVLVPGALAAVAGAAVSVVSEPILDPGTEAMIPPEVAGPRALFRAGWPPAIATLGLLPLVAAHRAELHDRPADAALSSASTAVFVLTVVVFGWVRFREEIHKALATAGQPAPTGGAS
jgi:hypothetical protein